MVYTYIRLFEMFFMIIDLLYIFSNLFLTQYTNALHFEENVLRHASFCFSMDTELLDFDMDFG